MQEPFGKGQKGSSAMPHKRNPVVAERICGLARVVRAAAVVGLENVALWHERDISHSSAERVVVPDAFLALDYMLERFTWLVDGLVVFPERMQRNLDGSFGLFFSQRLLLALVSGGLARDTAYRLVQTSAMRAWDEETRLPAARPRRRRGHGRPGRVPAGRRLRPRRLHAPRRHHLRSPARTRLRRGKPSMSETGTHVASGKVRELYALDDDTLLSPRATGSRSSTSSCRRRSRTRAASSPASPASGSRGRRTSSRTT